MARQGVMTLTSDEFRILNTLAEGSQGSAYIAEIIAPSLISSSSSGGKKLNNKICVAKDSHVVSRPSEYSSNWGFVQRHVATLKDRVFRWGTISHHPRILPLIAVHLKDVEFTIYENGSIRKEIIQQVPVYVFTPKCEMNLEKWASSVGKSLSDEALLQKLKLIARQVGQALQHLHSAGIVHRDLKCENVFCDREAANLCLADFGLIVDGAKHSVKASVNGCASHMAPEVSNDVGPIDPADENSATVANISVKADVWSYGMLLLEVLKIARGCGLENLIYEQYSHKKLNPASPSYAADRAHQQKQLQADINNYHKAQQSYSQAIASFLAHDDFSEGNETSTRRTILGACLQLERDRRSSMEHCVLLVDYSDACEQIAALRRVELTNAHLVIARDQQEVEKLRLAADCEEYRRQAILLGGRQRPFCSRDIVLWGLRSAYAAFWLKHWQGRPAKDKEFEFVFFLPIVATPMLFPRASAGCGQLRAVVNWWGALSSAVFGIGAVMLSISNRDVGALAGGLIIAAVTQAPIVAQMLFDDISRSYRALLFYPRGD